MIKTRAYRRSRQGFAPRTCSIEGWGAALAVGVAAAGVAGSAIAGSEQAGADEQASATQQQMFNTLNQQEQPYIQSGNNAETSLNQLLGESPATGAGGTAAGTGLPEGYLNETFNPTQDQLNNYPGYQFALQTGGQATRNADTPGVGSLSGAALKDLTNFDVGTANQNYSNYFNQFQTQQNNIFDRLSSIAGIGQNAAGNLGNNGAQLGTGVAQAQAAAGAATAGGTVGATNSIGNSVALAGLLNGNSSTSTPSYGTGTIGSGDGYTLNTGYGGD